MRNSLPASSPSLGHGPGWVARFLADDTGATAIEYGLIVALLAVVVITAVTAVGTNLRAKFNTVGNSIGSA